MSIYLCWTHFEEQLALQEQLSPPPPTTPTTTPPHSPLLNGPKKQVEQTLMLLPFTLLRHQDALLVGNNLLAPQVIAPSLEEGETLKREPLSQFLKKAPQKKEPPWLKSWGWHQTLFDFAKQKGLRPSGSWQHPFLLTPEAIAPIERLNRKDFLCHFLNTHGSEKLRQLHPSSLVYSKEELLELLVEAEKKAQNAQQVSTLRWRLKPLFTSATARHLFLTSPHLHPKKSWQQQLSHLFSPPKSPAIGLLVEPEQRRLADLSRFWEILPCHSNQIRFLSLGTSLIDSSSKGLYQGAQLFAKEQMQSIKGQEKRIDPSLEQFLALKLEKQYAGRQPLFTSPLDRQEALHEAWNAFALLEERLLNEVAKTGYRGPLTLDAFLMEGIKQKKPSLLIVPCDLNVRMSLGRVALCCATELAQKKNLGLTPDF